MNTGFLFYNCIWRNETMGDTKINYDEQFGMNTFRREICAALGEAFWETLTDGLILPDIETEGAFQCANMW